MELADEASVERCVQRLNGKLVPGSNPVSDIYPKQSLQRSKIVVLISLHLRIDLLLPVLPMFIQCNDNINL